eukprot:608254-Prymnesium_polylepis.1
MDSTEEKPNDIVTGSVPEGASAAEAAAPPSTPAQGPSQVSEKPRTAVRPYRGYFGPEPHLDCLVCHSPPPRRV